MTRTPIASKLTTEHLTTWEMLALTEAVRDRLPFMEKQSGEALLKKLESANDVRVTFYPDRPSKTYPAFDSRGEEVRVTIPE